MNIKAIIGIMVTAIVFISVTVAEDVAIQANDYVVLFNASDDNGMFADFGADHTGYSVVTQAIDEYAASLGILREEYNEDLKGIWSFHDSAVIVIGLIECNESTPSTSEIITVAQSRGELSKQIQKDGLDGVLWLDGGGYHALYPIGDLAVCVIVYLPLDAAMQTAVDDLEDFVESLVVRKVQLREALKEA